EVVWLEALVRERHEVPNLVRPPARPEDAAHGVEEAHGLSLAGADGSETRRVRRSHAMAFPRLSELMEQERARFRDEHPRSLALTEQAKRSLLGGVPMHWMVRWAGGLPVFAADAEGA